MCCACVNSINSTNTSNCKSKSINALPITVVQKAPAPKQENCNQPALPYRVIGLFSSSQCQYFFYCILCQHYLILHEQPMSCKKAVVMASRIQEILNLWGCFALCQSIWHVDPTTGSSDWQQLSKVSRRQFSQLLVLEIIKKSAIVRG